MYPVTDRYKELIASPVRFTAINGYVMLKSGAYYPVTDRNIKQGSLCITDKLNMTGDFRPGGVYSKELSVELIGFGDVASNLDGARIELEFRLYESETSEEYEAVPLGRFFVDGSTIERTYNVVKLKADDSVMLLNKRITEPRSGTLYELLKAACRNSGIKLTTTQEELEALPNGTLTATVNPARIQTERDLAMFVALCTGSFVTSDRDYGGIVLVPLVSERDSGGVIIPVREIKQRTETKFSDDTTRVVSLTTRRSGELVSSSDKYEITGSEKTVELELMENPLFAALSAAEVTAALNAVLANLVYCLNRAFTTRFNGDPALDVGDYVRLRGGAIDTARGYVTGMVTSYSWRYRGSHKLQCGLPSAVRNNTSSVTYALTSDSTDSTEDSGIYAAPKSQLEKRVDYLETLITGGSGAAGTLKEYNVLSDTSIIYNGVTYTFSAGDSGEITGCTTDKGGAFTPTIPGTLADISAHNAAFMAVALLSKLSGEPEPSGDIPDCFVRFNLDDCSEGGTTITLHNQAGSGDYVATQASVSDGGVAIDTASGGYGAAELTTTQPSEWTCYLVIKGGTGTDRGFYIYRGSTEINWHLVFGTGGGSYWIANLNNSAAMYTSTQVKTDKCLLAVSVREGAADFYINGKLISQLAPTGVTLDASIKLVSGRYYGVYYDSGTPQTVYDIALAATAHNAATVGEVSKMLMEKYNIGGTT